MYYFKNDYNAMCHPLVLEHLSDFAAEHMDGYGDDRICHSVADQIRIMCGNDDLDVHFLSGGTQANLIVIASALRPYQAVIAAKSAHIAEHETGAIEATGHKILELNATDGMITAEQILSLTQDHYTAKGLAPEHTPQPKLVYLSFSTEFGTLYSLDELMNIRRVCDEYGLYLYIDGARLGYGLCADGCDVTIMDIARLSDVFYIGGTKQGALFGEAVVIRNQAIKSDFRYMIKQRGAMLAKGWLVGLQFEALFKDDLYFVLSKNANGFASLIRKFFQEKNCELPALNATNQVFVILPDSVLDALAKDFAFCEWSRVDEQRRMVRFCTSWSTNESDVRALLDRLQILL